MIKLLKKLGFQQRSISTMVFVVPTMVFAASTMMFVVAAKVFLSLTMVFAILTMVFVVAAKVFVSLIMVFAILTMEFVVSTMVFVVLTKVFVTLAMVFITLTTVFVVPTMVLVFSTLVFGVEKMFSILDHLFSEAEPILRISFCILGRCFFFAKNKKYFFERQFEPYGKDQRLSGIQRARLYGYDGKGSYQDWYFNKRKKHGWVSGGSERLVKGFGQGMRGDNRPPRLIILWDAVSELSGEFRPDLSLKPTLLCTLQI